MLKSWHGKETAEQRVFSFIKLFWILPLQCKQNVSLAVQYSSPDFSPPAQYTDEWWEYFQPQTFFATKRTVTRGHFCFLKQFLPVSLSGSNLSSCVNDVPVWFFPTHFYISLCSLHKFNFPLVALKHHSDPHKCVRSQTAVLSSAAWESSSGQTSEQSLMFLKNMKLNEKPSNQRFTMLYEVKSGKQIEIFMHIRI